jgi:hypothetical protein
MGFKKLITGANGLPTDYSIGGLPLFSDDLVQMETNAQLFGLYSMLRGWSCILSGCEISEIDTDTKTLTILPGLILLNDVVYETPLMEGQSYPFSFRKGTQTLDTRIFKDGNAKDVAITYEHAVRTAFTYSDGIKDGGTVTSQPDSNISVNIYPLDITDEEIFFDPFTCQKAEYILNNKSRVFGETKMINTNLSVDGILFKDDVTKTETGNNVTGAIVLNKKSKTAGFPNIMRWKYYGYESQGATSIANTRLGDDFNSGGNFSNTITLSDNGITAATVQGLTGGVSVIQTDSNFINNPISIENAYQGVPTILWNSYTTYLEYPENAFSPDTRGMAYKFWKDGVYYQPNM